MTTKNGRKEWGHEMRKRCRVTEVRYVRDLHNSDIRERPLIVRCNQLKDIEHTHQWRGVEFGRFIEKVGPATEICGAETGTKDGRTKGPCLQPTRGGRCYNHQ